MLLLLLRSYRHEPPWTRGETLTIGISVEAGTRARPALNLPPDNGAGERLQVCLPVGSSRALTEQLRAKAAVGRTAPGSSFVFPLDMLGGLFR